MYYLVIDVTEEQESSSLFSKCKLPTNFYFFPELWEAKAETRTTVRRAENAHALSFPVSVLAM